MKHGKTYRQAAETVDRMKLHDLDEAVEALKAMPAAKFEPVRPRINTSPPVMYSQPCMPTPSTTAVAPELRTAKRSPATPRK